MLPSPQDEYCPTRLIKPRRGFLTTDCQSISSPDHRCPTYHAPSSPQLESINIKLPSTPLPSTTILPQHSAVRTLRSRRLRSCTPHYSRQLPDLSQETQEPSFYRVDHFRRSHSLQGNPSRKNATAVSSLLPPPLAVVLLLLESKYSPRSYGSRGIPPATSGRYPRLTSDIC